MSALGYEHTLDFITPKGVVNVTVREITTAEIRAYLKGEVVEPSEAPLALDVALWGGDPLSTDSVDVMPADIPRFTDLTAESAEGLTITQRKAVVAKIKDVNADFFQLVARWPAVVAELVQRQLKTP